jgi:hypothetical protein
MPLHFRVYDIKARQFGAERDDVEAYLRTVHSRFRNSEHAQTRVYSCRSWRATGGRTAPFELHWNGHDVPGETLLGSVGWTLESGLVQRIEAELAGGEAVRLFVFNSDADLCFEEVLVPIDRA